MQAQGGHAFGSILEVVAAAGEADWFVIHLSLQNLYSYLGDPDTALENGVSGLLDVAMRFNASARWAVVLRTNDESGPLTDSARRYRERVANQGIPVFRSLESAADAMRDFVRWHEHGATERRRRLFGVEDAMKKSVAFGLSTGVHPYGFPRPRVVRLVCARTSRRGGSTTLSATSIGQPGRIPCSIRLVLLSIAAASTRKARLIGMVIAPHWPASPAGKAGGEHRLSVRGARHPRSLAIGGDYPAEMRGCGVEPRERVARTEEAIAVMRALWGEGPATLEGRFQRSRWPRPAPATGAGDDPVVACASGTRGYRGASLSVACRRVVCRHGSVREGCAGCGTRCGRLPKRPGATSRDSRSVT